MNRRVALVAGLAVAATLAIGAIVVLGSLGAADSTTRVVLDAREAAARATDAATIRERLSTLEGWSVLSAVAEAAYYTQGSDPVDSRWGLGSQGTIAGEDAGPVIAGNDVFGGALP